MKTQILTFILFLASFTLAFAQEETTPKKDFILYSFIVNNIPDGCNIPMIGFVNTANGNHKTADIGFINYVKKDFTGAQVSFINTVGGNCKGAQIGFINTTLKNNFGPQVGFINTTMKEFSGAQIGFVNSTFKKATNIQVGFVNTSADSLKGAQIGFVNTSLKKTDAPQVGFINTATRLKGFQVGFINLADTIESGFPIGLLSIVKKGAYHAVELSVSEMYPINLSYKIGVSKLYTSFVVSYNPANEKHVALGAGLGSLLPLSKKLSFNPEFLSQTLFFDDFEQISSFTANVGYNHDSHLTLFAGPSVVWQYGLHNPEDLNKPFFAFVKEQISNKGNLISGARFSVRYKF